MIRVIKVPHRPVLLISPSTLLLIPFPTSTHLITFPLIIILIFFFVLFIFVRRFYKDSIILPLLSDPLAWAASDLFHPPLSVPLSIFSLPLKHILYVLAIILNPGFLPPKILRGFRIYIRNKLNIKLLRFGCYSRPH